MQRRWYPITCSECHDETATVPFLPDPGRQVFCRSCHMRRVARISSPIEDSEEDSEEDFEEDYEEEAFVPGARAAAWTEAFPAADPLVYETLLEVDITQSWLLDNEANVVCALCREDHSDGPVTRLPCCNKYCHTNESDCCVFIKSWLKKHCTCPFCRFEYRTNVGRFERGRKARMGGRILLQGTYTNNELHAFSLNQLHVIGQCLFVPVSDKLSIPDVVAALLDSGYYEVNNREYDLITSDGIVLPTKEERNLFLSMCSDKKTSVVEPVPGVLEPVCPATKGVLRNLPLIELSSDMLTGMVASERQCWECQQGLQAGTLVNILPCGHIFSCCTGNCLSQHLQSVCSCPLCEFEVQCTVTVVENSRRDRMTLRPIYTSEVDLRNIGYPMLKRIARCLGVGDGKTDINSVVKALFDSGYYTSTISSSTFAPSNTLPIFARFAQDVTLHSIPRHTTPKPALEHCTKEFGMSVSDVSASCAGMFTALNAPHSSEHLPQLSMLGGSLRDAVAALSVPSRPTAAAVVALAMYYTSRMRGGYDCGMLDTSKFGEVLAFLLHEPGDQMAATTAVIGELNAFCHHLKYPDILHSALFAAHASGQLLVCFLCALVMNDICRLDDPAFDPALEHVHATPSAEVAIRLFLKHKLEIVHVYKLVALELMVKEAAKLEVNFTSTPNMYFL
jgi:CxxC-x17-CxxC domain-containing protein